MNLPQWVHELLAKKFTAEEMVIIDAQWWTYNCISLSNSSKVELIRAAKTVLMCVKEIA